MNFDVEIYSPRWGHDDFYTITVDGNQLNIEAPVGRNCSCVYDQATDSFVWDSNYDSLIRIFRNDSIEAPESIYDDIEMIWRRLIQGRDSQDKFKENFENLADWISEITRSKPDFEY